MEKTAEGAAVERELRDEEYLKTIINSLPSQSHAPAPCNKCVELTNSLCLVRWNKS